MMVKDLRVLALDSSSLTGSIALCQGELLVAESLLNVRSTHSEKLLQQIDLLLGEAGWTLADIDLYAVVTGPGSFTGLRIGLATINGLAQVHGKPVIGVTSLSAVAMNLPLLEDPFCVFLDARKKEVYAQLFHWQDGQLTAVAEPTVCPPRDLLDSLDQRRVALVGDGVRLYRSLVDELLGERAQIPPSCCHQIRAANAAWLALHEYCQSGGNCLEMPLPTYVRPSDAELNLGARASRSSGVNS